MPSLNKNYAPPFTITSTAVSLVAEISLAVGRLSALASESWALRLRRANRIRTIHSSLAIEGNTLSEEQITAIMDGKRVIAPPREVTEVRNAIKAYEQLALWQPWCEDDLLAAHAVIMNGLLDAPGHFRSGGVGVMAGKDVVHLAPPAKRVRPLMSDLLLWLKTTTDHPLIAGSVFHYEFEFIHPFDDGNGRIGRLWQTLVLSRWNPFFAHIPVESLVHEHQQQYYAALQDSTRQANSAPFIEFMLNMILKAVSLAETPQVAPQVTPQVERLLEVLVGEMTRESLQSALGLQDRKSFRELYLNPALTNGFIEMTIPDKPNSCLQRYRLTVEARILLQTPR